MSIKRHARISRATTVVADLLRNGGVNHDLSDRDFLKFYGRIEAPVQISNTKVFHDFSFGAFSYITGGFLFHTHVGRYSSLSNGLHIGQSGHPIEWLSTNPFQYQRPPFIAAPGFLDRGLFEEDQKHVRPELSKMLSTHKPTIIGNDVWLGHGVYVKNGVKIGDGCVVGSRSVVTKDIPPYSVAYGTPAKVARLRFSEDVVERLVSLKWWDFAPWQLRHVEFPNIIKALDQIAELRSGDTSAYTPQSFELTK